MKLNSEKEQKLLTALKRISLYDSPEKLRRRAEKDYGLTPHEAIEMAYENVLAEAKEALRGMRQPRKATP